jgi:ParB family transcriptional regulator, chromosome partitioning protein
MATAIQKITLSSAQDIPFNKLVLSQSNVRRVKAGVSIDELAESIARRGLIQSLHVRPVLDAEGQETGMYEVPAGGRRFRALQLLVKQKRLTKTSKVPCVVSDANADILVDEVSLAENIERAPLHPLDQFRAFQAMREKGMTEEAIAAAFFASVQVVKQRLRLAAVSPALLDIYAEDGITLEQLMAFTVTDDHARQEQVWESVRNSWQKEPYQIRRMLTESAVRASDKRAVFVGIDAYETAGGCVLRDLFQDDDGGWLQDPALLDRLVADKLKASAEAIAGEGWKWIEVAMSFPYGATHGLREIVGTPLDLTADEQATIEALNAEYAKLEAEYEHADELPDEIDQRLGEIETALASFDERPVHYEPADIAIAGVFVSLDADGTLSIDRGYVRPDDEPANQLDGGEGDEQDDGEHDADHPMTPSVQRAVITIGGKPAGSEEEDEDDTIKPLPDRLITELTADRTLALRDKLASDPSVAFVAVLHKFCQDVFYGGSQYGFAMEVSVRGTTFHSQPEGLRDSVYAKAIEARHDGWRKRLPGKVADLWDGLAALTGPEQAELFAHCASFGVNALYEKADRYGGRVSAHSIDQRIAEADRLSLAVGLDMAEAGWRPTVANYLGRVTKPRILEAVREGVGERAAHLIEHLKKGDMATEAERLLVETGWLPEPLRNSGIDAGTIEADAGEGDDALPDFLAGDDEETVADDDEEQHLAAAE